jgi:hypothetical protein
MFNVVIYVESMGLHGLLQRYLYFFFTYYRACLAGSSQVGSLFWCTYRVYYLTNETTTTHVEHNFLEW